MESIYTRGFINGQPEVHTVHTCDPMPHHYEQYQLEGTVGDGAVWTVMNPIRYPIM